MRTGSFFLGLIAIGIAMAPPIAGLDRTMLTGHMVQHLLLMTIAPPLIWLGVPAPRSRWPLYVCWIPAALILVGWHIPAAFRLGMESAAWHLVEDLSFLGAGMLFWWPVIQQPPRWSILPYLFLATLPCDVLSAFLVFSDRIAYPMYICTPQRSAGAVLEDQQCAGALMWTVVTVVYFIGGTILATRMLSPGHNAQAVETA